ncbi:MAG: phosphonopyruvate decarboxylase [Myxococcales bacterium]|nr:phosphonopyruvate decarboxylase [Myxococcales bacterium]
MLEPKDVLDTLTQSGVEFFSGVPDSLLKSFCAYVTDNTSAKQHVITANEGGALALAAGSYLATGKLGLVYMQNSGLGNAVNPLTSLADPEVYGIPMLLMVGWRGEPDSKDEPQHVKMGKVTLELLSALGVQHAILPDDWAVAKPLLSFAVEQAKSNNAPFALVVPKDTFANYALQTKSQASPYEMSREQALGIVLEHIEPNALVVCTTGMPSRELFEWRERRGEAHASDFLTVGCMGHASQIALGVALQQPERPVYCIDGDGAVIMHMGALSTIGALAPNNFRHVVLNNAAHDSVGGQPTVGFAVDFAAIARGCGYNGAVRADNDTDLRSHLQALTSGGGPVLVEIRIHKGARPDLGRPTESPAALKRSVMHYLA